MLYLNTKCYYFYTWQCGCNVCYVICIRKRFLPLIWIWCLVYYYYFLLLLLMCVFLWVKKLQIVIIMFYWFLLKLSLIFLNPIFLKINIDITSIIVIFSLIFHNVKYPFIFLLAFIKFYIFMYVFVKHIKIKYSN